MKKIWRSIWGKVVIIGAALYLFWQFWLKDKYNDWKNEKKKGK
jgi:hypothetical protein